MPTPADPADQLDVPVLLTARELADLAAQGRALAEVRAALAGHREDLLNLRVFVLVAAGGALFGSVLFPRTASVSSVVIGLLLFGLCLRVCRGAGRIMDLIPPELVTEVPAYHEPPANGRSAPARAAGRGS